MPGFKIHVLGSGSAKPTLRHQPACTVVEHNDTLYMIDCGEGAQQSLRRKGLKLPRLRHIFLTHLHGDHVLGLVGLLSTLKLGDIGGKITIHTFAEGERIIRTMLDFFAPSLSFELDFNIIKPEDAVIFETSSLRVRTVCLQHRVPDVGYIFEEKPKPRHLVGDMVEYHQVPIRLRQSIKEGADYVKPDGTIVPNRVLTRDADPSLSYAHISDTRYLPDLARKIGPVTLLFHETTYQDEHEADAKERFHSTARQAATVARDAGAKALLTGHYSSRYKTEEGFREEALQVFDNVIIGTEQLTVDLLNVLKS